jgi:ABC-type sugar transport system ATPase subunit
VLVVSTDTDELVQVAHRVVVMVNGVIAEEFSGAEMTTGHIEHALLATQKAGTR